jgi:hypothetical protein
VQSFSSFFGKWLLVYSAVVAVHCGPAVFLSAIIRLCCGHPQSFDGRCLCGFSRGNSSHKIA